MQFGDALINKTSYNCVSRFTAGNATINLKWVPDLETARSWNAAVEPVGDILGTDVLPFLLQSQTPAKFNKGLRGLVDFNEAFCKVETTGGWFFLRSLVFGAMMNQLKES